METVINLKYNTYAMISHLTSIANKEMKYLIINATKNQASTHDGELMIRIR